jgi:hypothetical protein
VSRELRSLGIPSRALARPTGCDDDGVTERSAAAPKFWHERGRFWWTGLVLAVVIIVRAVVVSYPHSLVELTIGLVFLLVLVTMRHPRAAP